MTSVGRLRAEWNTYAAPPVTIATVATTAHAMAHGQWERHGRGAFTGGNGRRIRLRRAVAHRINLDRRAQG